MKRIRKSGLYLFLLLCISVSCLIACNDDDGDDPRYALTDYSDSNNWLYVSGKNPAKGFDVFYVYPTTYSGNEISGTVTDIGMRAGAQGAKLRDASAYEETANLYMPYYRQLNATKVLVMSESELDGLMREFPAKDIIAAFTYYLENYNNNRPFILAGHSQGSNTLLYILEQLKSKPEVLSRMVAAYVIGFAVTPEYMAKNTHLKFASGRTDTQVVISWNTESPGVTEKSPVSATNALVINPITWTTDETHAGAELSLGSRLQDANGLFEKKEHFADAQVDKKRGAILCSTVNPEDYKLDLPIFPLGVLHGSDYPFYYYDLQQNVKDRAEAYRQANK